MDKLPFLTEEFYGNPFLTINVINDLLSSEIPLTVDYHYSPGLQVDHLTFNNESDVVKEELSKLISDMPAYLEFHKKTHWDPLEDEIPINALLVHYSDVHFIPFWKKSCMQVRIFFKPKSRKEASNV